MNNDLHFYPFSTKLEEDPAAASANAFPTSLDTTDLFTRRMSDGALSALTTTTASTADPERDLSPPSGSDLSPAPSPPALLPGIGSFERRASLPTLQSEFGLEAATTGGGGPQRIPSPYGTALTSYAFPAPSTSSASSSATSPYDPFAPPSHFAAPHHAEHAHAQYGAAGMPTNLYAAPGRWPPSAPAGAGAWAGAPTSPATHHVSHHAGQQRRRGKLPKHTTDLLKEWLHAHSDHPYPSEDEKRDLCARTKLSMSQVSNWMINARRRILQPAKMAAAAAAAAAQAHPSPVSPLTSPALHSPPHLLGGLPGHAPPSVRMHPYPHLATSRGALGPRRNSMPDAYGADGAPSGLTLSPAYPELYTRSVYGYGAAAGGPSPRYSTSSVGPYSAGPYSAPPGTFPGLPHTTSSPTVPTHDGGKSFYDPTPEH